MIDFKPPELSRKADYDRFLWECGVPGCEYTFTNLYVWGRQRVACLNEYILYFSQFDRRSDYPFPVGKGDLKPVLDAVIDDAGQRGIPCRLTGLSQANCARLAALYPGRFRIHCDRSGFDYVYAIDDLADLKGRKFQRKRNHLHKFRNEHPRAFARPVEEADLPAVEAMLETWYAQRLREDPHADFHMERAAIHKALRHRKALALEGLALWEDGRLLAVTFGSRLGPETFDVHFEKALSAVDGAYAAINQAFAAYLRTSYPEIRHLNREDDMGLEGLRKAKLSYCPEYMEEKYWACLLEDDGGY